MKNSKIEWTDHTFNPWWGCTKVSPACKNCYAETLSKRVGQKVWGATAERRFFGDKHWNEPLKWAAKAKAEGRRARVFCASMADVCEIHPDPAIRIKQTEARQRLLQLMVDTEGSLDWLLLSKRWGDWEDINIKAGLGYYYEGNNGKTELPPNAWAGATVENQEQADKRIQELRLVPAKVRFLSMEPLLGPVALDLNGIDWVIVGGESGPNARPMHPDWARNVRDQCKAAGVPFFFKQWGEWGLGAEHEHGFLGSERCAEHVWPRSDGTGTVMRRVGKKAAGRLLDGVEHNEFPELAR